jgi:hypothetical protein
VIVNKQVALREAIRLSNGEVKLGAIVAGICAAQGTFAQMT